MAKLYLLYRRYIPGEALTNRLLAYSKGFAKNGAETYLCFLIPDKQRSSYSIDIPGVTVIDLWKNDGYLARRYRFVSMLVNLARFYFRVEKGDLIFQYGMKEYQLLLALLLKHKAKVFCEVTEHPDFIGYNKYSKMFRIPKLSRYLDGLFVISNTLKELYINEGVHERKIEVINMFVDTNRFLNLKKSTSDKYIAYCGAVSYNKDGCDILIKAFSIFHRQQPDYKLYIIGKGVNDNVIPELMNLAKETGVEDSVKFTGLVEPKDMPQLLFDASILALARPNNIQAQNGFPTKLGEYLATGNPVVVTTVGEIPDFIKHKENGFLSNPEENSFAEQLLWVAENYAEARIIGLNGKKLVFDKFSYLSQSKKALDFMLK